MPAILELLGEVEDLIGLSGDGAVARCTGEIGKGCIALLPGLSIQMWGQDPARARPWGAACEAARRVTQLTPGLGDGLCRGILLDDVHRAVAWLMGRMGEGPEVKRELLHLAALDITAAYTLDRASGERPEGRPQARPYGYAGLFSLALGGGAVLAGARVEQVERVRRGARHVGAMLELRAELQLFQERVGAQGLGLFCWPGRVVGHAFQRLGRRQATRLYELGHELMFGRLDAEGRAEARSLLSRAGSLRFALEAGERHRAAAKAAVSGTAHGRAVELIEVLADVVQSPWPGAGATKDEPEVATAVAERPRYAETERDEARGPARASKSADTAVEELGVMTASPAASSQESDSGFLARLLPEVSRTFALSIEALPEPLRATVRTAYMICRVVDTIEDEPDILPERRHQLFAQFAELLAGKGDIDAFSDADEWKRGPKADLELCRGARRVFNAFSALDDETREAIRAPVLEMCLGMDEYTQRASREGGLRIRDIPDLERYCYFVAGTVGELLTRLFVGYAPPPDRSSREALDVRAVPFGIGLQLVNILKDVAADFERGVCYLPEDLMAEEGVARVDLLRPSHAAARARLVEAVAARARIHLTRAVEYTLLFPAVAGAPVRFFCAVPLALAFVTLEGIEAEPAASGYKVSRPEVFSLFGRAREAVAEDASLWALFEEISAGQARRTGSVKPPLNAGATKGVLRSRSGPSGRPGRPQSGLGRLAEPSAGGPVLGRDLRRRGG